MQVCTSLNGADNHASTPPLSYFTGQMPFLPPNQQRQRTEGMTITILVENNNNNKLELNKLTINHATNRSNFFMISTA